VRKDHLLLTVDKSDSDIMQRQLALAPAAGMISWRLDQSVRDTTARYALLCYLLCLLLCGLWCSKLLMSVV
jgi:hypothetical protein